MCEYKDIKEKFNDNDCYKFPSIVTCSIRIFVQEQGEGTDYIKKLYIYVEFTSIGTLLPPNLFR